MSALYDRLSADYDQSRSADARAARLLAEVLGVAAGSRVLDIGCGTGNFALAMRAHGAHVTGLDLSMGMLKNAAAKGLSSGLVRADAVQMPFANAVFDSAYAVQVLHHIARKDHFFAEARRVLKDGGVLAIQSCSHAQLAIFWQYYYWPVALELDKQRIPDIPEICALFRTAGFTAVGQTNCPMDPFLVDDAEKYLDKSYHAGFSALLLLKKKDVDAGCAKLAKDVASGKIRDITTAYRAKALATGGIVTLIHGRASALGSNGRATHQRSFRRTVG
jgi:SAM-dependent methyltransferase